MVAEQSQIHVDLLSYCIVGTIILVFSVVVFEEHSAKSASNQVGNHATTNIYIVSYYHYTNPHDYMIDNMRTYIKHNKATHILLNKQH